MCKRMTVTGVLLAVFLAFAVFVGGTATAAGPAWELGLGADEGTIVVTFGSVTEFEATLVGAGQIGPVPAGDSWTARYTADPTAGGAGEFVLTTRMGTLAGTSRVTRVHAEGAVVEIDFALEVTEGTGVFRRFVESEGLRIQQTSTFVEVTELGTVRKVDAWTMTGLLVG
jgi:hypothetical protein